MTDPPEPIDEHALAADDLQDVQLQTAQRREKMRPLREVPHPFGPWPVEPATAERWIERGGRSQ